MIGTSAFFGRSHAGFAQAEASSPRMRHRGDAFAYRALFALTFTIFLPAVVLRRALVQSHGRSSGARRSIIEEAKIAASTASACAFMG